MTKEELIASLKDPEVKKAMKDLDVKSIIEDIEITDDDTVASVAKKFQQQMKDVVKHFTSVMEETKRSAVEEATAPARNEQQQKILKFTKENPGMSNKDLVAFMDPLYASGMSLEDAYAKSCKALDINPKTGKGIDEKDEEDKGEKKEKKSPEKKEAKKSIKTVIEDDDDIEEETKKDDKPKSLRDTITANMNKMAAEGKDPFTEKSGE